RCCALRARPPSWGTVVARGASPGAPLGAAAPSRSCWPHPSRSTACAPLHCASHGLGLCRAAPTPGPTVPLERRRGWRPPLWTRFRPRLWSLVAVFVHDRGDQQELTC